NNQRFLEIHLLLLVTVVACKGINFDYLKKHGAEYVAFDHPSDSIYRSDYMFFVKQIIEDTDLVLCFYNGDKHTSVIPVDVAKEAGIDAVIYDLPGLHEKQMKKNFEQKIRMM
ncbi:hypothetical protein ACT4UT_13300, partial [Bacillus sp. B-TM1]